MRRLLIVLCALVMSYAAMAQGVVVTSTGERITLPNGCKQAIVVVGTTGANCKVYKMTAEGTSRLEWRYELIEGVTGYAGIAAKDRKREGDGKTPQGLYALNRGLYYVNDFTTKFPMEQYYERYIWDENPYSATYNSLLRNPAPGTKGDKLRSIATCSIAISLLLSTTPRQLCRARVVPYLSMLGELVARAQRAAWECRSRT